MDMQLFTDKKSENLNLDEIVELFKAVDWPHAEYPEKLLSSLTNSQELVTAFIDGKLVGLANAVGDENFYAYIHWLIVHPKYQGKGIARKLATMLLERLESSNQVFVIAESNLVKFWETFGFIILSDPKGGKLIAAYRGGPKLSNM